MVFAIKNLFRGFAGPAGRAKSAATGLGLAVACRCPNKAGESAYLNDTLEDCASDVVRMLHREYDARFAGAATLAGGARNYAVLEGAVGHFADSSDDPDICEKMLDVFEEEWELNYRSPFASAFYGTMLYNTGYAWLRTGDADDTSAPGYVKYRQYLAHAHDVFLESAPKADQCPFWHRMFSSIGAADGSAKAELRSRFDRAVAFDPFETSLYATRMHQLLPRLHGSFAEMDAFALESIQATRAEHGTAVYAMLYSHVAEWERLPDTHVNYNILRQSFFDWSRKNKSQHVTNALVNAAFDFEDYATIDSLLSREWTEFHPDAWHSPNRAAEALGALVRRRKAVKLAAA
jgi:hypothetical protein